MYYQHNLIFLLLLLKVHFFPNTFSYFLFKMNNPTRLYSPFFLNLNQGLSTYGQHAAHKGILCGTLNLFWYIKHDFLKKKFYINKFLILNMFYAVFTCCGCTFICKQIYNFNPFPRKHPYKTSSTFFLRKTSGHNLLVLLIWNHWQQK